MTDKGLKELKDTLWHSADVLRASAHLAANKYGQPILGLIFLRYADILYKQHKEEIETEYNRLKGGRMENPRKRFLLRSAVFIFRNVLIMTSSMMHQTMQTKLPL